MKIGWLVYGAACAGVPILWGLVVCRILRDRPAQRALKAERRPAEAQPGSWDYTI